MDTLKAMRTEEAFSLFFDLVSQFCEQNDVDPPILPRKRRAPKDIEVGTSEGYYSVTVEEYYRIQNYEALDIAISSIVIRFDQPGYAMYKNLETLLECAANGQVSDDDFQTVTTFYKDDLDRGLLSTQLLNLGTQFAKKSENVSLAEIIAYLRGLSVAQKSFFSEVCCLARLILVMPAIPILSVSVTFQQ